MAAKLLSGQAIRDRSARLDELERSIRRMTQEDGDHLELGKAKAAAWASEMSEGELIFYVDAGMKALSPELRRKALAYFADYSPQRVHP